MLKLSAEAKIEVREQVLEVASLALDKIKQDAEADLVRILSKYYISLIKFDVRPNFYENIYIRCNKQCSSVPRVGRKGTTLAKYLSEAKSTTIRDEKLLNKDLELWELDYGAMLLASVGDKTDINILELRGRAEKLRLRRKFVKVARYLALAVGTVGLIPASLFFIGLSILQLNPITVTKKMFEGIKEFPSLFKKELEEINKL
jgi:hypothetical protein